MNPMREIRIEKITLNIGVGEAGKELEKAFNLLKDISGRQPVKTKTWKRIPTLGVRPGLEIGTKVTMRDGSEEMLKRLFEAVDNKIKSTKFTGTSFSFGIPEYINIPGAKYNAEIGIIGLECAVTLERKGFRIKRRRLLKKKIPAKHSIPPEEAIEFVKSKFNVEVEE